MYKNQCAVLIFRIVFACLKKCIFRFRLSLSSCRDQLAIGGCGSSDGRWKKNKIVRTEKYKNTFLTSSRDDLFKSSPCLRLKEFGLIRYNITAAIIISIIHVKLSAESEPGLAFWGVTKSVHSLSVQTVWPFRN